MFQCLSTSGFSTSVSLVSASSWSNWIVDQCIHSCLALVCYIQYVLIPGMMLCLQTFRWVAALEVWLVYLGHKYDQENVTMDLEVFWYSMYLIFNTLKYIYQHSMQELTEAGSGGVLYCYYYLPFKMILIKKVTQTTAHLKWI